MMATVPAAPELEGLAQPDLPCNVPSEIACERADIKQLGGEGVLGVASPVQTRSLAPSAVPTGAGPSPGGPPTGAAPGSHLSSTTSSEPDEMGYHCSSSPSPPQSSEPGQAAKALGKPGAASSPVCPPAAMASPTERLPTLPSQAPQLIADPVRLDAAAVPAAAPAPEAGGSMATAPKRQSAGNGDALPSPAPDAVVSAIEDAARAEPASGSGLRPPREGVQASDSMGRQSSQSLPAAPQPTGGLLATMELMRQQQVAAAAAVAAAAGAAPKGSPLEGSKDSAEGADLGPDHGFGGGQTRALTKKELATGLHLVLGEGMSEFLAMGVHPTLFAEYLEQIKAASWAMWSGPGLPPANMLRQRMHVALTSPLAIRLLQLDINAGLASKGVRAGPAGLLQGLPLQVPPGMMPMQMAGLGGVDPMLLGSPQHNVAAAMAAAAAAAAAAGGNWPGAGGVPGMLPFPPFGPMATAQMGGGMVDPAMLAAAAAAQQPGAAELEQILLRQQQLQQAKQESHDEQHQQHQQQHQQQHRKQQQTPHGGEAALRRKASSGSGRAGGAGGGSRVRGVSVATAAAADALMGQDVPAASPAERDGDAAVLGRWPSRGSGRQQGDAHARGGAAAGAEVAGPAGKGSGGGAAAAAATAAGAAAAAALGLSRLEALMAATEHVAGLGGEEEGAPESDLGAAAARGEPAGVREAGVPKAGPGGADDPLECEEDFFNAAAAAAAAAAMGGGAAAAATVGVKRRRGASAGAAGAGIADPGAAGTKGLAAAAATAAAMALDRTALLLKAASAAAAADPELRAGGELAGGAMGPHADGAGAGDDDDDDGDDDGDDDPWLGPPGAAGAGAGAGAAGQRSSKARRALAGGRTGSGSVGVGGAAAAQLLLGGALGALGGHGHSVGVGRDGRVLPDGAYTAAAALRRGGGGDDDASMGDGDEDAEYMMGGSGGGMGGGGGGRGRSPATGGDRGGRGWPSGKVGRDDLKQYYHLQAREAAKLLGMALSCFKKVCRRLGVPRWPARKLVCLQRMASTLRTMTNMSAPEKQEALRRVRQNIEDILEDPETAVYEDIRKLLHGQYKMRTNQRQGKSGRISGGGGGGGGGGGSGSGGGRPRPSGAGGGLSGDGDDWDDEDDGEDMMLMAPGAMD